MIDEKYLPTKGIIEKKMKYTINGELYYIYIKCRNKKLNIDGMYKKKINVKTKQVVLFYNSISTFENPCMIHGMTIDVIYKTTKTITQFYWDGEELL